MCTAFSHGNVLRVTSCFDSIHAVRYDENNRTRLGRSADALMAAQKPAGSWTPPGKRADSPTMATVGTPVSVLSAAASWTGLPMRRNAVSGTVVETNEDSARYSSSEDTCVEMRPEMWAAMAETVGKSSASDGGSSTENCVASELRSSTAPVSEAIKVQ